MQSTTISLPRRPSPGDGVHFLVTSYMLGGPDGRNLGAPGYSHEFVARLFRPLLERLGRVTFVRDAERELSQAIAACLSQGERPVHFSVLPFQDVTLAEGAHNVVMPAWEFPDVPDHAFDHNPRNDWPAAANRCDLVIVSGPFTEGAFLRAGTTAPIRIVPVPTPEEYFSLPFWSGETTTIGCPAYVFESGAQDRQPHAPTDAKPRGGKKLESLIRGATRGTVGPRRYEKISTKFKDLRHHWRRSSKTAAGIGSLPYPRVESLDLSGVVYTSIFAPDDGRKNWADLLNAYLVGLADEENATLVVKLIAKHAKSVRRVIDYYLARGLRHRCRLVFICDFLSDDQMLALCRASTFYVHATKAEGNCLPLMNYLAAGRPGVSPRHSSLGDYFDAKCGFVVESHPEPAAWPHDRQLRLTTTWARIVWPSLRDQIVASHRLACEQPAAYASLAARCRGRMQSWAAAAVVADRLESAIGQMLAAAGRVPLRSGREDHRYRDAA